MLKILHCCLESLHMFSSITKKTLTKYSTLLSYRMLLNIVKPKYNTFDFCQIEMYGIDVLSNFPNTGQRAGQLSLKAMCRSSFLNQKTIPYSQTKQLIKTKVHRKSILTLNHPMYVKCFVFIFFIQLGINPRRFFVHFYA